MCVEHLRHRITRGPSWYTDLPLAFYSHGFTVGSTGVFKFDFISSSRPIQSSNKTFLDIVKMTTDMIVQKKSDTLPIDHLL